MSLFSHYKNAQKINLVITLSLLVQLGCTKKTPTAVINEQQPISGSQSSGPSYRIGEISSRSGNEALFGSSIHQGIVLAIEEANEKKITTRRIELITSDSRGVLAEALVETKKLIEQDQVIAVIGETSSNRTLAVGNFLQERQVPFIVPAATDQYITTDKDFVFRVCFKDEKQASVLARFAGEKLNSKRAVVLMDSKSGYSVSVSKFFQEAFKKYGTTVAEFSYKSGDRTFEPLLQKVKLLKPDFILVPGFWNEVSLISRQARKIGITVPFLGGDSWDTPNLRDNSTHKLGGSYFVSHFASQSNIDFSTKFKKRFGSEANGISAMGYDSAWVLISALRNLSSDDLRDVRLTLRKKLAELPPVQGVSGLIDFDSERNARKSAIISEILADGKIKTAAQYD